MDDDPVAELLFDRKVTKSEISDRLETVKRGPGKVVNCDPKKAHRLVKWLAGRLGSSWLSTVVSLSLSVIRSLCAKTCAVLMFE